MSELEWIIEKVKLVYYPVAKEVSNIIFRVKKVEPELTGRINDIENRIIELENEL